MSTKHLRRKLAEAEKKRHATKTEPNDDANPEKTPSETSGVHRNGDLPTSVETDENSDGGRVGNRTNAFALLNADGIDEDDELGNVSDSPQLNGGNNVSGGDVQKKKKSKGKKKRAKKAADVSTSEEQDFDAVLLEFGAKPDQSPTPDEDHSRNMDLLNETELFRIEFRNLDPEVELRRMIGQKIGGGGGGAGAQAKGSRRGGKLVHFKNTWPLLKGTGLSMVCVKNLSDGVKEFSFEHNANYQMAQKLFWEAVEAMNPDVFVAILRQYPYHVDTLLQLAEAMRINEDFQQSRDLIERAVYACEAVFHPLFNVTTYRCRLDYRQRENRPFFLALYRRLNDLAKRGQFRTALETAKLLYSLAPDDDPMGVMLLIDYLALRSRQYDYLAQLYTGLEASRNLSMLPNFCYSTALALFLQQKDASREDGAVSYAAADEKLTEALLKFPTMLLTLLDQCSVEPDAQVSKCPVFQPNEQFSDSIGLKQLIALYCARCAALWKDTATIAWLEDVVRRLLPRLPPNADREPTLMTTFRAIRRTRFVGTPPNVLRHIVTAELKEATATLPLDVRDMAVLAYDPLPPADSRAHYERTPTARRRQGTDGLLTAFVRSLMPNYDPDAPPEDEDGDVAAGGGGMHGAARNLVDALRNLMNNVQMIPPPGGEQQPHPDGRDGDQLD